jgi:dynein heavy chain
VINVPDAAEETLNKIFEDIIGGFLSLKHFDEKIKKSVAVQATIEMYQYIQKTMLPIPAKFHYTFNLRDVAKVFQGILMSETRVVNSEEMFAKVWLHECTRVFADRLCSEKD